MIERHLTLCANGRAELPDYAGRLLFGYAHNSGVYRLCVTLTGEWAGTTVRALWRLPGQSEPLTTLLADGGIDVPARVTALSGSGTITFEGSDGTRTVASASVPYTVWANDGTADPDLPEPGTPAWQQLMAVVQKKLHAAASGLSDEERGLILALFKGAAYSSAGMQTAYDSLAALWSGSSLPDTPSQPTDPDQPSQPDTPETPDPSEEPVTVAGEKAVYELRTAKQFLPTSKEYIDTGVKLFEDIAAKPTWTILVDANDFGRLKNLTVSPVMFHCGDGVGSYFSVAMWLNGACMLDLYGYETRLGWWGGSTSAHWIAYIQIKGTQFRMGSDPANDAWQDIPKYTANITSSLLLGAGKSDDGKTIMRYWDGTVNRFAVYKKELTNAQINTFLEGK